MVDAVWIENQNVVPFCRDTNPRRQPIQPGNTREMLEPAGLSIRLGKHALVVSLNAPKGVQPLTGGTF
jgi:hypothetical protein